MIVSRTSPFSWLPNLQALVSINFYLKIKQNSVESVSKAKNNYNLINLNSYCVRRWYNCTNSNNDKSKVIIKNPSAKMRELIANADIKRGPLPKDGR